MRKYLSESIGAFFLVFVAAGSVVADVYLAQLRIANSFGLLGIALAYGLAVAVALSITARHSRGFVNPVVSVALFVARRLPFREMLGYLISQLVGAVAAAFLLRAIAPSEAFRFAAGGVPGLGPGVSPLQGTAIEVVLTFFLVYAIWSLTASERAPRTVAPLAIGAVTIFNMLVGAMFTGAVMNPARWFGPALAAGQFSNWGVWIAGPLVGALLGSLLYETFFLEPAASLEAKGDRPQVEPVVEGLLSEPDRSEGERSKPAPEPQPEEPAPAPASRPARPEKAPQPWPPLPPVPQGRPEGARTPGRPPEPPSL